MNPLVLFFILIIISFFMFIHLFRKLGNTWIIVIMMFIYFLILRYGIQNEHKNLEFNEQ